MLLTREILFISTRYEAEFKDTGNIEIWPPKAWDPSVEVLGATQIASMYIFELNPSKFHATP